MMSPELVKLGLRVRVATLNDALLRDVPLECKPLIKSRREGATGKVAYIAERQGPIAIFSVVQHDSPIRTENVRGVYHCDELEGV
jgi:hypothetical protein